MLQAAPREADAKEGEGNKINSSTATAECARHEGPATENFMIKSSTATEGHAQRQESDTDEARNDKPVISDERSNTDAGKACS